MDKYKTVFSDAEKEYIIKHSKFIGYIKHVETQQEATDFINQIKSKHWDATHNVYAYVLREGNVSRYSDDGEPQGTAGIPVLEIINKTGLVDCAIVVTRYFGGILLGAGGLVRAYAHTAKLAIDSADISEMAMCNCYKLCSDYNLYGKLNSLVTDCGGIVDDTEFNDNVIIKMHIQEDSADMFISKVSDLSNGKLIPELICKKFDKIG